MDAWLYRVSSPLRFSLSAATATLTLPQSRMALTPATSACWQEEVSAAMQEWDVDCSGTLELGEFICMYALDQGIFKFPEREYDDQVAHRHESAHDVVSVEPWASH